MRVHTLLLLAVVALATLLGWLRIGWPGSLESWDWLWYDRMAFESPGESALEPYVVILVDDESLEVLGERWPMSRARWAEMLGVLGQAGPALIALDVWFERPEPSSGLELLESLLDDLDTLPDEVVGEGARAVAALAAAELPKHDANRQLTQAIARAGRVILGMACVDRPGPLGSRSLPEWLMAQSVSAERASGVAYRCEDVSASYSELGAAALHNAGVNMLLEPDGRVRRYPFYFAYQDQVFPSLASAVVALSEAGSRDAPMARTIEHDGGILLVRPFDVSGVATLSLVDVLDASAGRTLGPLLEGKRVFVGVSALGTRDTVAMPGVARIPAVYSHVMAAVNLERGSLVQARSSALWWSVIVSVLALLGMAWLSSAIPVRIFVLIGICVCILSLWLADLALDRGVLVTLVPLWIGVFGLFAVTVATRLVTARREREEMARIRGAFQHYVAPEVIAELLHDRDRLRLGGERRDITAFFADIAGFTRLAERIEPAQLVQLLNEVLTTVAELVIAQGGIVDKYVGDSTVAMFGAPIEQPDHALRACRVALACQEGVLRIRERWRKRDLPDINVRIAVNSGVAVVGNIGSEARFDYTMLGDTVNLAARLESVNNVYGTSILVGAATYEAACHEILFREIDVVRVKGKDKSVAIYEPLALADDDTDDARRARHLQERYQSALALYRARSFEEARTAFEALAAEGDRPSREMAARASRYVERPPPEDWGAVFVLASK